MTSISKILPVIAKYLYLYEKQQRGEAVDPAVKIPIRQIQDDRLAPYNTGVMGTPPEQSPMQKCDSLNGHDLLFFPSFDYLGLAFIGISGVVASDFLTYLFEKFREDKSFPAYADFRLCRSTHWYQV